MTSLLIRSSEFVADGRQLSACVVPYGRDVQVDGGRVRFEAGAFTRSVQERGAKIKVFAGEGQAKVPVGTVAEWREAPDGLHAVFEIADTHRGDDVLKHLRESPWSIGIRPIQERQDGDILVRTEAALIDVTVGRPQVQAPGPQLVIPRSVALRRLELLELEREII